MKAVGMDTPVIMRGMFCDKCFTFEFSHFLSPQSIYPSAKNLNTLYRSYYENKPYPQGGSSCCFSIFATATPFIIPIL